jgi:hypothetical protein
MICNVSRVTGRGKKTSVREQPIGPALRLGMVQRAVSRFTPFGHAHPTP